MKLFNESDILRDHIYAEHSELVNAPMWWHTAGKTETRTGYGKRLNSGLKINFNGRLYRIYVTCFSNAGTAWFVSKGRKIVVS